MTVIKSKRIWRENFEKKNLKHKDTTWMIAESLELTMSLTSFQEEMKKRWNWGKDSPQTGGRRGARTAESLWRQQRDQRENRRVRTARHPERRECGTRFSSSFGIIPPSSVCAERMRCLYRLMTALPNRNSFISPQKGKSTQVSEVQDLWEGALPWACIC